MDQHDQAQRVADAFSKNVIVRGVAKLEEDERIFSSPEHRFQFELDALNSILVSTGKLDVTSDGKPSLITPNDFAGAKMVALGKHLAVSPASVDILAEGVKILGQLSKVAALTTERAAAHGMAAVAGLDGRIRRMADVSGLHTTTFAGRTDGEEPRDLDEDRPPARTANG